MGLGSSVHPWVPPFAMHNVCYKEYDIDEWIGDGGHSGSGNLV